MDDSDDDARQDYSGKLVEIRKLKKQVQQLQAEMEDKDSEVYIAETALKDAERKCKNEQAKHNDELDEKQEQIEELENEIQALKKKLKQVSKGSSYESSSVSHENELQKKVDTLLAEMNNKDQQILEMEKEMNKANISEEKEIKYLKSELQDQMKILSGKEEKIKELTRSNNQYIVEIDALREKNSIQENELVSLREQVQDLNRKQRNRDSSNENDTSNNLVKLMEQKDSEIARIKEKLRKMKNNQTSDSRSTNEKVQSLVKEISLCAGIKINDIDEAIKIIKDVIQKPQPKMRHNIRQTTSRDGGEQVQRLMEENENLTDEVEDLQRKLETAIKRHKKELAKKDEEIQEMQEEFEEQRTKSTNDYKTKAQLSSLREKVQELEYQLEKKNEELELQVRKYKEMERKYSDKVGCIEALNIQISEFQRQARDLAKTNNELKKDIEDQNDELQKQLKLNNQNEMIIQDKMTAINKMKTKFIDSQQRAEKLDVELRQKLEDFQHLQKANQTLSAENKFCKTKIENQEREIGNMRINNFQQNKAGNERQNSTNLGNNTGFPDWWNIHKV